MSEYPIYLTVRENEFAFYIEPTYSAIASNPIPTMTITRPEGIIKFNEPVTANHFISEMRIKGLLGIINLHAGPYVIVVTDSDFIGEILEKPIFRVLHVKILPCHTQANLSSPFLQDELIFLGLLEKYLNNHSLSGLYYSRGYDLCSRLQLHIDPSTGSPLPPRSSMENQFVANRKVLGSLLNLIQNDNKTLASHFVLPCIQGFVGIIEDILIGPSAERISLAVISRRSSSRVGVRFHSRGIDEEGNVSNFVETEQILIHNNSFQSFTQVRGSIPVFWRQNINIHYKPPLELDSVDKSSHVFRQHFDELKKEFGGIVVAINLVDSYGFEGKLAASFAKNARSTDDFLHYIHFDYHSQVHGHTEPATKLESLNRMVTPYVDQINWLHIRGSSILQLQSGIIRTNCVDCLDRTNVTQSALARLILTRQLQAVGLLSEIGHLTDPTFSSLLQILRNLWADNGDSISRQYSGTVALKSDLTRTGRRTYRGMLNDGINSIIRFYRNNFIDANTQDAMDLFFGRFQVSDIPIFVYRNGDNNWKNTLIVSGLVVALLTFITFFRPIVFSSMIWALITILYAVGMAYFIIHYGIHFVKYPKLLPPPIAVARSVHSVRPTSTRSILPQMRPQKKVHQI